MAKEKDAKITKVVDANLVEWTDTFRQNEKDLPFTYTAPKDAPSFKAWVSSLTGDSLDNAYGFYMYAADLKGRASQRESVAAESTIIMKDKKPIDLMLIPVEKRVLFINAAIAQQAILGGDLPRSVVVTRRKTLEAKQAHEQNGQLVATKVK